MKKIEIIDFKKFCAGGSPEYIKAKKHLDDLRNKGLSDKPSLFDCSRQRSSIVYSIAINPIAFIDVKFAILGAAIILVAILEKGIAQAGMVNLAAALSGVLRVAFPIIAVGSMIYLISMLGAFL